MQGQDWNPVVLRAKQTTTSQKTSKGAVAAALRSGTSYDAVDRRIHLLLTRSSDFDAHRIRRRRRDE